MIRRFAKYYKPHLKLLALDTFCSLALALCNLFYPYIAGNVVDDYALRESLDAMFFWCAILLLIFVLKAVLNYVVQYWGHVMGVRIQADMRRDFFAHVQKLPFSFFDENKTGTIMSRIINDLFDVSELAHHGIEDVFLSVVSLVGALVMVCLIDVWLALVMLAVMPFMCWFAIVQRRKMKGSFDAMRRETGEINAEVESAVSGIRVSKAYSAASHEIDKFDEANGRFKVARGKAYKSMGVFGSGMGLFSDLLYLVTLLAGGLFLYYGRVDSGEFTSYVLYATMVISPIRTLTAIFESIQSGMTGFRRFTEIMNYPEEAERPDAVDAGKLSGEITFDNVTFGYNGKEGTAVLNNLSFHVDAGKTIALVGPSGGGKTTLCHLIPRFYLPQSGTISIDGKDINQMTVQSLRRNIGIVAQDVFLFGGTIRENIAYGNLDATDEEIVEAAKRAGIHDFVTTLPDGYDTQVGERGVKLSGGQKQRVSIARAFLKNPPILILDEATSALDNFMERQIQQSLDQLSVGRTTIVVAHRLSTVKNADEILVIADEGVVERGTHKQLLQKGGVYARLYGETLE